MASSSEVSVTITPVYGAHGGGPMCSLLTVNSTRILLDCGWTDAFDPAVIEPLRALAPTIDLVLLSHADIEHAGALPVLLSKWKCPALVLSTLPVNRMGQMYMYDSFLSRSALDSAFAAFTLDDVDSAFRLLHFPGGRFDTLRFHEERSVKGVTVVPMPSGRTIGGSLWRVTKGAESILYAVGFNHRTERHLGKAASLSLAALQRRPTVMIADSVMGLTVHPAPKPQPQPPPLATAAGPVPIGKPAAAGPEAAPPKLSAREAADKELVDTILGALRGGGNVLLPTDTAGRCLELLLRLEEAWPDHAAAADGADTDFPVVFLNHVAPNTLEFAKTMLEYMTEKLTRSFASLRVVPFQLERVAVATSLAQLDAITAAHAAKREAARAAVEQAAAARAARYGRRYVPPPAASAPVAPKPVVVLASFPTLECGFGRDLLTRWGGDGRNLVLFTDASRLHPGTTGAQLAAVPTPRTVSMHTLTRLPLMGQELRRWEESRAEEAEAARTAAAAAAAAAAAVSAAAASAEAVHRGRAAADGAEGEGALGDFNEEGGGGGGDDVAMGDHASGHQQNPSGTGLDSSSSELRAADGEGGGGGEAADYFHAETEEEDDEIVGYTDDEDDEMALRRDWEVGERGSIVHQQSSTAPSRTGITSRFPMFGVSDEAEGPPGGQSAAVAAAASSSSEPSHSSAGAEHAKDGGAPGSAGSGDVGAGSSSSSSSRKGQWTPLGCTIDPHDYHDGSSSGPGTGGGEGSGLPSSSSSASAGPTGRPGSNQELAAGIRGRLLQLLPGRIEAAAAAAAAAAGGGKTSSSLSSSSSPAGDGAGGDFEEVPTKLVRASQTFRVGCRVVTLGSLGGRADAPAVRHMVEDVSPLRLVLLYGSPKATAALAEACRPFVQDGVDTPAPGAPPLDVSSHSGEFVAVLDDSLFRRLAFRPVGPYQVAFVESVVAPGPSPALIPVTRGGGRSEGHTPSLVRSGPLLLPDIRTRLARSGIETDLVEGGLVTKGGIVIQRTKGGRPGGPSASAKGLTIMPGFALELEGPPCPEYYAVRRALYEAYTMV